MGTEEWISYESNPNLKIQKGKKIRVLIRFPFFLTHKIGSLFSPASKPKKDVVPNLCIAGLAVKKRTPDFIFLPVFQTKWKRRPRRFSPRQQQKRAHHPRRPSANQDGVLYPDITRCFTPQELTH